MNTSLEHLPEHKQQQLREITATIVKAVDPEKVILFGSHASGRWVEHRYSEGGITYEYISDYDILVITKSGDERKDYEVQDIIENRCIYKTPVTVIVHDIEFINKMLSEGQYFSCPPGVFSLGLCVCPAFCVQAGVIRIIPIRLQLTELK